MAEPRNKIRSPKELENWLEDKPVDWAQVIAARIALRVFPVTLSFAESPAYRISHESKRTFILASFRAIFISWAARQYRAHDMSAAATAAAIRAGTFAEAAAYAAANANTYAAVNAVNAAAAAEKEASAYADAAPEIWEAISEDCRWLEANEGELIGQPLWLNKVRHNRKYQVNFPIWTEVSLDNFADSDLGRQTSFGLIIDWYRSILPSSRDGSPRSRFGEWADIEIAMQPNGFWTITDDRPVERIMDEIGEIAGWEAFRNSDSEKPLTQFIVEYLEEAVGPRSIDEIRAALHEAGYDFIDKSMRGALSILATKGRIVRVRTGVYQRISDVPLPPSQGHGPHLGVRDGQLVFAPVSHIDEPNTDLDRVRRYLPLAREALEAFLAATSPALELGDEPFVRESGNDPFAREKRQVARYLEASEGDVETIDFDLLFGVGTSLMNRRAADANRSIESDLPPLSDAQLLALEDFQSNHGRMIVATAAGAEAIADAERLTRNPEEERQFRETVVEFMNALGTEKGIANPEVVELLQDAATEMGTGHQAERSFRFGQGAARNTAIVLTSVGTITALPIAGLAAAGTGGAIVAGVLSYVLWEATKKSKPFSDAIKPITGLLDGFSEMDLQKLDELIDSGTAARFARFTLRQERFLRTIAGERPDYKWLHEQLDYLKEHYRD